jgi:hypothetical protein
MHTLIQARASKCDVNFPRMEQDFFHLDFYYRSFWPQVKIAQAKKKKKEFGFFLFYFDMLPRLGKVAISNAQRLSLRPVLKANLTRLPCYTPSKHEKKKMASIWRQK